MKIEIDESDPNYDREITKAQLKAKHPEWTEKQIERELNRKIKFKRKLKRIRKSMQLLMKQRMEQYNEFRQRSKLMIERIELHKAGKIPPLLLTSYIGKYEVRAGCLGKQLEIQF